MDPRFGTLGSPALDRVNDASLFTRVLSFLSGPDVARASATSVGWNQAANDPGLWKELYERGVAGEGTDGGGSLPKKPSTKDGPPPAKSAFRDRYQRQRDLARARAKARDASERRRQRHDVLVRQSRALEQHGVLQALLAVGTPMPLMLAFVVLLAKRMDGSLDWPYLIVSAPLFMMMGVSVLSIAGMCVARARRNDDDHQYGMVWAKFTYMPSRLLLAGMLRDEPNAFWHHGIVTALLITQVGCVPLRLDGVITSSWSIVFVPVFIALAVYAFAPCCKTAFDDHPTVFAGVYGTLLCFLLPLIILAALAADGADIPMGLVLMPFWILGGLMLCCATAGAVSVCNHDARDRNGRKAVCGGYFAVVVCVAPWILFEVFLTLKASGSSDMSWEGVFAPLMAWLTAASGGGIMLAKELWTQVVVREARRLRGDEPDDDGPYSYAI